MFVLVQRQFLRELGEEEALSFIVFYKFRIPDYCKVAYALASAPISLRR
ncbi:hypothetical protein [Brachymonas sp.]